MASPLADAHIEAQRRLRVLTGRAVADLWTALPGYDRENIDQWLSGVLPVVSTARRTSVSLTEAYLARAMERRPLGVNPESIVLGLRNGTPADEVYQRPFVTVWTALSNGVPWQQAVAQGLNRATSAAAMDVQLAMRSTADEVGREDDGIWGFQRVADGGACAFCLEVDGAYVKDAGAMPLHNHCGCGLEPLPDRIPHERAVHLPDGTQIREYQGGPLLAEPIAPPGVAVHDHGELGPVLTDPAHNFETAALALS